MKKIVFLVSLILVIVVSFLINMFPASVTFASQFPSEYPSFIPPGYSKELKAKYRIIEHSSSRNIFYINDTDRIVITEEGINMYPPVYTQTYTREGWISEVVKEILHTTTAKHNIYLIEKNKPIHQSTEKRLFVPDMNYPHVAKDEETLETYTRVRKANDLNILHPVVRELYTKRKMFQVENNVKVKILQSKNGSVQIKVLGGLRKGQIGWVISDWVK